MAEQLPPDNQQLAHTIEMLEQRVKFLESKLAFLCHIDCPKKIKCRACEDYGCEACGKYLQMGMGLNNNAYFHNTCAIQEFAIDESGSFAKFSVTE